MHGSYAANMAMTALRPADRAGRALRRPRYGPPGGIRAARQGHPRGYRPGGDRQEPHRRRAHRGRREARARQAEQGTCGGRPHAHTGGLHRAAELVAAGAQVERGAPAGAIHVRDRDQAAAPDVGDRPRFGRQRPGCDRRGPAPDVGRAVPPLQRAAAVAHLRRAGLHGLRTARRRRSADGASRTSWFSPSWATAGSRCRCRSCPPS